MVNPDLAKYVETARSSGASDDAIRSQLSAAGWGAKDVDLALAPKPQAVPGIALPPAPPPVARFGMWVGFEYAILFITLYVTSIALGSILNVFVDNAFPSPTSYGTPSFGISFQLASLIVAGPIFLWFFAALRKQIAKVPAVRNLKLRKNLIYITLFIAALIVIGDLIWNIYDMLSGNWSLNGLGHLLVVILIAGSIFAYFIMDVKEDREFAAST